MTIKKAVITNAQIHLKFEPEWSERYGFYAFEPSLFLLSLMQLDKIAPINTGYKKSEAKKFYSILEENFKKAKIFHQDEIAVLLEEKNYTHDIIAISRIGSTTWIDVKDECKPKSFLELNNTIESLEVFILPPLN